jgi:hypothetical protein
MTCDNDVSTWSATYSTACHVGNRIHVNLCRLFGRSRGSRGVLFTRLGIVIIAVIALSGCGKLQQDLDTAKKQIETLTVETKGMAEKLAKLGEDRTRLNDEMKLLTEKNEVLRSQVAALEKAKAAVATELDTVKKSNEEALAEVESLKRQKADLTTEMETLKKLAAPPSAMPLEPKERVQETAALPDAEKGAPPAHAALTPCNALLQYMKESQAIVRRYKGEERSTRLGQLKHRLAQQMSEAPEKAVKAAENWVAEVIRVWDDPRDDSAFILLSNKGAVLEACHMTPEEAGF